MNMVATLSQERQRMKRTVLRESEKNAGIERQRQLETSSQKSSNENGNNMKKNNKAVPIKYVSGIWQIRKGFMPTSCSER
jgi:hypothetical protein